MVLPFVIEHAQQHLVVRPAVAVLDERRDQLRLEPQAVLGERRAHVGGHVDVGEAADDADVVFLESLQAVAAAVLGGFAGSLGLGQRAAELGVVAAVERRHADADRQAEACVDARGRQAGDTLAQAFAEHRGLVDVGRHGHGETVAGDARRHRVRRQVFAQQVADLRDGLVADVHAEVFVDDVQLVDVDVQQAPAPRARLGLDEHELDALLERGARQQAGERVVAGLDAGGHAARQQVGEVHVAADELRRVEPAEQRQHARGAARALAQRAGEDAKWNGDLAGLRGDLVDHQRVAARLRDRQQLFLRARQDGGVAAFGPGERESLVGHHDAGQHALEMRGGVGQQRLQVVGTRGLRMAAGDRQQQLEILVARGQVFVELLDVGARQQVAAQQLERRPQVVVHVR
jgi:hypothetical protein